MKSYICRNCGYIVETNDINNYVCPGCNSNDNVFDVIEDKLNENEIDAIIGSVIEDDGLDNSSKIINNNIEEKYVNISEENNCIYRVKEKCINCGQCRKTCENETNIHYDMNTCKNPVCIGCGRCIKNCPSNALIIKEDFLEIKKIIEENSKIVVGILCPEVIYSIKKELQIEEEALLENKLITYLKNLGFDFVFNGKFGNDMYVVEESNLLFDRIKNGNKMPLISSFCPGITYYIKTYHKDLLNNLSSCNNPYEMQAKMIKEYFSKEKGLDSNKFVVTVITSCLPLKKDIINGSNIDYVMTTSELIGSLKETRIKLNNLEARNYDDLLDEGSGSGLMCCTSGGLCESIIRTIYFLIKGKKLKKEYLVFDKLRNNDKIKNLIIKIDNIDLKVAVIQNVFDLEKIIKNNEYKNYNYIELMNCNGGCISGGGQFAINENDNYIEVQEEIYKVEKEFETRCSIDNKKIQNVYKNYLGAPNGELALNTVHREYNVDK